MKRYIGEIYWFVLDNKTGTTHSGNTAKIRRAILNENVFKLDVKMPNPFPDSEIRMRSKDGFEFDGSAKYVDSPKSSALLGFDYYFNGKKAILTGNWEEDKVKLMCIIRLTEVDNFKD